MQILHASVSGLVIIRALSLIYSNVNVLVAVVSPCNFLLKTVQNFKRLEADISQNFISDAVVSSKLTYVYTKYRILIPILAFHMCALYSDRNYSNIENLLLFNFLQKDYSKRCNTVFKRKGAI